MDPEDDGIGFTESYQILARTLRTWLVAYGIGAPVLFASQPSFSKVLEDPKKAEGMIYAFLGGVVIQIIATFIYKIAMWYLMLGCQKPAFKSSLRYRLSDWLSEQLWLEVLFDLASMGLFAWATARTLLLYLAP
jgi:hypothetical protein